MCVCDVQPVQTSSHLVNSPLFYLSSFPGNGDFQGRLLSFIPLPTLPLQQCEECNLCWLNSRNVILSETRCLKTEVAGKCNRARTAHRAKIAGAHACAHEQFMCGLDACWSAFSWPYSLQRLTDRAHASRADLEPHHLYIHFMNLHCFFS